MNPVIDTPRMFLAPIENKHFDGICHILQDPLVMYAWEHGFTKEEATEWICRNSNSYQITGYGYCAVIHKKDQNVIGLSGILNETAGSNKYIGLGYIFNRNYWGKGYAFEMASACKTYALEKLGVNEITAQIRHDNFPSQKVAIKLGLSIKCQFTKTYLNKSIVHYLFSNMVHT